MVLVSRNRQGKSDIGPVPKCDYQVPSGTGNNIATLPLLRIGDNTGWRRRTSLLAHDMGRHEMNPCGHCGNKEGVKACVCRRAFYCGTRYNIYYIHHMIETLHLVLFIPAKVEELTCPVCFEVASVPIFMCDSNL